MGAGRRGRASAPSATTSASPRVPRALDDVVGRCLPRDRRRDQRSIELTAAAVAPPSPPQPLLPALPPIITWPSFGCAMSTGGRQPPPPPPPDGDWAPAKPTPKRSVPPTRTAPSPSLRIRPFMLAPSVGARRAGGLRSHQVRPSGPGFQGRPQLELPHLAVGGEGQVVDHLPLLRDLERRQPLPQVGLHLDDVDLAPVAGRSTATTRSPQCGSGRPSTADWPTAGWLSKAVSTSAAYTFTPPVTIMSLSRPTMRRNPSASSVTRSPVSSQRVLVDRRRAVASASSWYPAITWYPRTWSSPIASRLGDCPRLGVDDAHVDAVGGDADRLLHELGRVIEPDRDVDPQHSV